MFLAWSDYCSEPPVETRPMALVGFLEIPAPLPLTPPFKKQVISDCPLRAGIQVTGRLPGVVGQAGVRDQPGLI